MDDITFDYRTTNNPKYWMDYLNRRLSKKEECLLDSVGNEYSLNKQIEKIYHVATDNGLFVPYLTPMSGNCFFESLEFLKLYDDAQIFRDAIGTLMLLFKNKKHFIPTQELSLEELFVLTNEIEYVFCNKTDRFYKYNFDAMCLDIMSNAAWTRLPTEMIMSVISIMMNIEFVIVHNNGHITKISTVSNENTVKFHLGLIGELHYIPLMKRVGYPHENQLPIFSTATKVFHKWAQHHAYKLGRYIQTKKYYEPPEDDDHIEKIDTSSYKKLEHSVDSKNLVDF